MTVSPGTIYLLCFEHPVAHAKHYLGWTDRTAEERLADHLNNRGSPLVHAAKQYGKVQLVRTWAGDCNEERRMKNNNNLAFFCPFCCVELRRRKAELARRYRMQARVS